VNIKKNCFFGRAESIRGSVVTAPLILPVGTRNERLYSGASRFDPDKEPPIPTKWEAAWPLEPVQRLWKEKNSLAHSEHRNTLPRLSSSQSSHCSDYPYPGHDSVQKTLRFSEYLAENSLQHYKEQSLNMFQRESCDLVLGL